MKYRVHGKNTSAPKMEIITVAHDLIDLIEQRTGSPYNFEFLFEKKYNIIFDIIFNIYLIFIHYNFQSRSY